MTTAPDTVPDRSQTAASAATSPVACKACPWRLANQGKRHPDGWYTKRNLARLWAGLRRGGNMSCHPTDPRNPVSDQAQARGYHPAPDHAEVRECVGSLVLRQREVTLLDRDHKGDPARYRAARPRGLTRDGIASVIERLLFGGTIIGGAPMPLPDLNDPDIGYGPLGNWTPLPPVQSNTDTPTTDAGQAVDVQSGS